MVPNYLKYGDFLWFLAKNFESQWCLFLPMILILKKRLSWFLSKRPKRLSATKNHDSYKKMSVLVTAVLFTANVSECFNSYVSTFIYCCFTQSENKPFFLKKYVPKVIKKLCWDSYMFSMSTHAFSMNAPYRQVPRADACAWLSPPVLWWPCCTQGSNFMAKLWLNVISPP